MAKGRLVGLSIAGVAILAVGIVLGASLDLDTGPVASTPTAGPPPTTASTTAKPSREPLGGTWLADLKPTGSTSVDDTYVESPWTTGDARVRGAVREKSVSATGAWCGTAQLEFAVDGGFDRLTAHVAVADNSPVTKPLDFYLLADGVRVVEFQGVGNAPQPVDVSVAGAKQVAIGVEPPDGDQARCPGPERIAVWAEARLVPKPGR